MTTRVVLYDLAGKPQELEDVYSVLTYESHVAIHIGTEDEHRETLLIGWHRVHEVRIK